MHRLGLAVLLVLALLVSIFVPASPPAEAASLPSYTITPIAGGTGVSFGEQIRINNRGQVVFWAQDWSGTLGTTCYCYRGFLWTPTAPNDTTGTRIELAPLNGDKFSYAYDVNDLGQVAGDSQVGTSDAAYPSWRVALWQDGMPVPISPSQSTARGVNNAGQIVGFGSLEGNGREHAFLWQNGSEYDLGTLEAPDQFSYNRAYDINKDGVVVGMATTPSTDEAIIWTPAVRNGTNGTMSRLVPLPGGYANEAKGINDAGAVVGTSSGAGFARAVVWRKGPDGQMQSAENLGTLLSTTHSYGRAINGSGQVVGLAGGLDVPTRPFLWQDGAMTDLNTLLPPYTGWELVRAEAINDSGQIVGIGKWNNEVYVLLLTPVTPKPGGLWVSPSTPNGFQALGNKLYFAAHAYPERPGDPAIDHVTFTASVGGGVWQTACTVSGPRAGTSDYFECLWTFPTGISDGPLTVSFDVYDKVGNRQLAPNGTHQGRIDRTAERCECVGYVKNHFGLSDAVGGNALVMGPYLEARGFRQLTSPEVGAVVIFQPGYDGTRDQSRGAGHVGIITKITPEVDKRTGTEYLVLMVEGANQKDEVWTGRVPKDDVTKDNCTDVSNISFKRFRKSTTDVTYWKPLGVLANLP